MKCVASAVRALLGCIFKLAGQFSHRPFSTAVACIWSHGKFSYSFVHFCDAKIAFSMLLWL